MRPSEVSKEQAGRPLEAAELYMQALQAEDKGLATLSLEVTDEDETLTPPPHPAPQPPPHSRPPQVRDEDDQLRLDLEQAFCTPAEGSDTAAAWNEQRRQVPSPPRSRLEPRDLPPSRRQVVARLLRGLLYPHLARELKETLGEIARLNQPNTVSLLREGCSHHPHYYYSLIASSLP